MRIFSSVGDFAGDKDAAAHIRDTYVRPNLEKGRAVLLDFTGVELATQSFVHALLAAVVREDPDSLETIDFEGCNDSVRELIQLVVDYAQDSYE